MNKRKYTFFVFCLFVLLVSSLILSGCTNRVDEDENRNDVDETREISDEDKTYEVEMGEELEFSSKSKEIGVLSENTYKISLLTKEALEDFYRFSFEIEGVGLLPYTTAEYRPEFGAIRIVFQQIQEDNSGIDHQKSYNIDNEGLVRIYHNISPNPQEEIYDIGVTKEAKFSLYAEELGGDKWKVNLDVEYPGEYEIDVDLGSDEFGIQEQKIEGATSSDGARITNYSYGIEENVFRFVWSVRGSQDNPIPEVKGRYNNDGELLIIFPDLDSDYIGRDSNEVELLGDVEKVVWKRNQAESIYRFVLKNKKDFRLSSSLSPNQVILEIEL